MLFNTSNYTKLDIDIFSSIQESDSGTVDVCVADVLHCWKFFNLTSICIYISMFILTLHVSFHKPSAPAPLGYTYSWWVIITLECTFISQEHCSEK